MTPDESKSLIKELGSLIDARAKTTETLFKGEIASVHEKIDTAKEELRAEILASRAEAKADHLMLRSEVIQKVNKVAKRTEELEKEAGIPNPDKH